jgi:hypothetical protein
VAAGNYQDFVEKINIAEVENPAGNLVGGFILGSSDFVNWVKEWFAMSPSISAGVSPAKVALIWENILATYPAPASQSGTIIWQSRFSSITS